ncbi:CAP domain-containing protein [Absidia repens]|uniref:CAP domain-containing protein n=1 Tax=Absidia repens TaxID=90262 RepID=A0A1X2IG36_9FUNG|nr:CAP domain-containing protein [Absidia repens]
MRSVLLITLVGAVGIVYGNVVSPTGLENDHHASVDQTEPSSTGSNQVIDVENTAMIDHDSLLNNDTISDITGNDHLDGNMESEEDPTAMSMLASPGQIVQMHNIRRARHQVGPVRWNANLANYAQRWANQCHYGHTNDPRYGENIAMGLPTWESVMKAWSDDEEGLFNFQSGGFSVATGHFTQIVWKGTSMVGCAAQRCARGIYFVCEYAAPGNVRGQYRQNVFPRRY